MNGDNDNQDANLGRRLEELEALLARQKAAQAEQPEPRAADIPILDELVTPEDYPVAEEETETAQPAPSAAELDELAERLEQKFTLELEQTVRVLRDNLKNSIRRELDQQIQEYRPAGVPASDRSGD